MMIMNYFKDEPKGIVVSMDVNQSGHVYAIWFPYTKEYMKQVREGALLAVKNYDSNSYSNSFSILELTTALPRHYALGSSASDAERAFPGFVIEAAKNARIDWEQEEPIEQTTKIRGDAICTGLQLTINGNESKLEADNSLPMVGEDAHMLTDEQIKRIVNKGLVETGINTITPCNLIINKEIPVHIATEDLLKTHFGIFGFTGSGKSNLISNIIYNLCNIGEPNKVILFDLMTEYAGILIDVLHQNEDAYILYLSKDSLPGSQSLEAYLRGDKSKINEIVDSFAKTLLLPKDLVESRLKFKDKIKDIISSNKIRIFDSGSHKPNNNELIAQLFGFKAVQKPDQEGEDAIDSFIKEILQEDDLNPVSIESLERLSRSIAEILQNKKIPVYSTTENSSLNNWGVSEQGRSNPSKEVALKPNATKYLKSIKNTIDDLINETNQEPFPSNAILSFSDIIRLINDGNNPIFLLIQSNRDDEIRFFSSNLVNRTFEDRRIKGKIFPHTLFIFDEADEFIPQNVAKDSSYAASKSGCNLLARRGRKFGLGIAIATQRLAYLDTSILAQPHTFLLSKMPRAYDRQVIAGAFGVSEELLNKTLSFNTGQWLLFSYDATGLTNVPIPVQFPNANDRIKKFLK